MLSINIVSLPYSQKECVFFFNSQYISSFEFLRQWLKTNKCNVECNVIYLPKGELKSRIKLFVRNIFVRLELWSATIIQKCSPNFKSKAEFSELKLLHNIYNILWSNNIMHNVRNMKFFYRLKISEFQFQFCYFQPNSSVIKLRNNLFCLMRFILHFQASSNDVFNNLTFFCKTVKMIKSFTSTITILFTNNY